MKTNLCAVVAAFFLFFGLVGFAGATTNYATQSAAYNACTAQINASNSSFISSFPSSQGWSITKDEYGCALGVHAASPAGHSYCVVANCYNAWINFHASNTNGSTYSAVQFYTDLYTFTSADCTPGDSHSGNWPGTYATGVTKCIQNSNGSSCLYTFQGSASNGTGGDAATVTTNINFGAVTTTSGTWTTDGSLCSVPSTPPMICSGDGSDPSKCTTLPPPHPDKYCDQISGKCVTATGSNGGSGPPSICAGDNCMVPPPIGGPGGCATGSNSALCASPGVPQPGPSPPPPPLPPNPPIDPSSPQPPPIIVITMSGAGGSGGSQQNSFQSSSCGGSTGIPCGTGGSSGGGQGGGSSGSGSGCTNGWCPGTCPAGQSLAGALCSGGGSPTCSDNSPPNSDGNCRPPQCGAGYSLGIDGACHQVQCQAGFTLSVDGTCKPVPHCPDGTTMGSNGQCFTPSSCPAGMVKGADGTCVSSSGGSGGTPPSCPPNFTQSGSLCYQPPIDPGGGGTGSGSGSGSGDQQGSCTAGAVCNDHASGGYDCSSAPACTGDSVLCNIDFQSWHVICPGRPMTIGGDESFLDQVSSQGSSGLFDTSEVDLSQKLDSAGFMAGSGACVAFDPIDVVMGTASAHIDWSNSGWCAVAQALGVLLIALSYFRAYQIVMRG